MNLLKEKLTSCIANIDRMLYYFSKQQYFYALRYNTQVLDDVMGVIERVSVQPDLLEGVSLEQLLTVLQSASSAQQRKNYVLLADIYELQMMPVLTGLIENIAVTQGLLLDEELVKKNFAALQKYDRHLLCRLFSEDMVMEITVGGEISVQAQQSLIDMAQEAQQKGYAVEVTSCGQPTLARLEGDSAYYFHTNGRITRESIQLAQEWLAQEKETYTFYGLGMGYPYQEMLLADYNISVQVIESNRDLLVLAVLFAPLYQLLETERFTLIYDEKLEILQRQSFALDRESGFYIFYPALCGIETPAIKNRLEEYFVEESSVRVQGKQLTGNFKKNTRGDYGTIEDLKNELVNQKVIIVAGGPSLDKNILELKKKENVKILAVGTVLSRLMSEGVRPDYVIIIDAKIGTYRQIEGLKECGVPLIFLSTVFSGIVKDYCGEKYILCQRGFYAAEELAQEKSWELVETGGSVVTAALDLCLRCGVSDIAFAGLDLAYSEGMDHASGTAYQSKVKEDTGVMVEGIDGTMIPTAKNLKLYKEWIEKRLAGRSSEEKKITVYDATEGGALVKGTVLAKLADIF